MGTLKFSDAGIKYDILKFKILRAAASLLLSRPPMFRLPVHYAGARIVITRTLRTRFWRSRLVAIAFEIYNGPGTCYALHPDTNNLTAVPKFLPVPRPRTFPFKSKNGLNETLSRTFHPFPLVSRPTHADPLVPFISLYPGYIQSSPPNCIDPARWIIL